MYVTNCPMPPWQCIKAKLPGEPLWSKLWLKSWNFNVEVFCGKPRTSDGEGGRDRGKKGNFWAACLCFFQLEGLYGGLCWSGNGGSSAIRTVWFLNLYSSRSQLLNFVVLTKYSPSWRRSDSYLAFSPWDDLQIKTVTSFHCYLPNNSKLCYSHKLTESLALSLPSAPDGFYHLMKPDSFFSPSFIIYY